MAAPPEVIEAAARRVSIAFRLSIGISHPPCHGTHAP